MQGLHELIDAPSPLTVDGKIYWLTRLTLDDFGAIEKKLLERCPRPLDVVRGRLDGLSEASQLELAKEAFRLECKGLRATDEEVDAFTETREGATYKLWLMLRRRQPELTPADAERLALVAGLEAIIAAMRKARGAPLGNFFRHRASPMRALCRGVKSFATSLRRMAGRRSKSAG